jgi:Protein of unknown function (DUF2852)
MTYDSMASGQSGRGFQNQDYFSWAKAPGFHPMKLLALLVGFAIFPPLGIAALVYFLWMGRRGWARGGAGFGRGCGRGRRHSGNAAFDAHQEKILTELREERRAFHEHRAEERRKRDQAAYDAFRTAQAEKDASTGGSPAA